MLKSYKSSLNLNSYKLDSRGYEDKIKQLISQIAEVKFQLQNSKSKQEQLLEELKNVKLEVFTLRNMMKNQFVVHENKCKNCAAFSKQSIDRLISDLEEERTKVAELRSMYENEVQNKNKLTNYYEKRLHNLLKDKDLLVKKYEEKMRYLSSQASNHNIDSSTSIHNHLYTYKSIQQIPSFPDKSVQKPPKNMPPSPRLSASSNSVSNKLISVERAISNRQVNISSSDVKEIMRALVYPIVQRLRKMQISFDELKAIPQVQRFSQTTNPPKNRFIKLLQDFPFECQDDDLIEQAYNCVVKELQGQLSGGKIIELLTEAMKNTS